MTGIICSVDKKWLKKERYGSFSYDDRTRLYPKSAVTGNLSEDDRMNVEIMYRKKMEAPPPSPQGIYYSNLKSSPHMHACMHTHKKLGFWRLLLDIWWHILTFYRI